MSQEGIFRWDLPQQGAASIQGQEKWGEAIPKLLEPGASHEKELLGVGFHHSGALFAISPPECPARHGLNPSACPWRGEITPERSRNGYPALDGIQQSRGQIQKYYPEQKAMGVILIAHCRKKKKYKIPELQHINQFWFRGTKRNHHKPEKHPPPMASNQSYITRMDFPFIS